MWFVLRGADLYSVKFGEGSHMLEIVGTPHREEFDSRMRELQRSRLREMTVELKWQRYQELYRLAQNSERAMVSDRAMAVRRQQKIASWLRIREAFAVLD